MKWLLALVAIFLYILVRFRKWQYGLGAIIALFHDTLFVIAAFAFAGLLGKSFEIDQVIIAAMLTIIGYSINDTVIVFDRIRENFFALRGKSAEEAMNISINEMLARTLITGLTTLLVLIALLTLGGESIAPFSIALIVGIIVGTYSSIYTASATALALGISAQDLIEPIKDPTLIDDLP